MDLLSRYRGALLGLAVGDALGTTVEFSPPGTFAPIMDMVGGGPFHLSPGAWTDDTSMALCLAESLIERQGFDPVDQLERYVRWWRHGHLSSTGYCVDIGITIRGALSRFERTHKPWCGPTNPASAGNGSLMRVAPVVLAFARTPGEAVRLAGESSRTTHGAQEAIDACRYFAALLCGALHGAPKEQMLSDHFEPIAGIWRTESLAPHIDEIAAGSFRRRMPPAICGSGYVARSLEAALWAFDQSASFREGALLAVNLGDDADTTGAIYGQLAGTYYSETGIPSVWLERIVKRDLITAFADRLYQHGALPDSTPSPVRQQAGRFS